MRGWLRLHRQALSLILRRLARTPAGTLLTVIVFGVALSLPAGLYLLLQNLGIFTPTISGAIWAPLFGLGGMAFLLVFIFNREQWWALIPGLTLLGLAVLVAFGDRLGTLGAAIFMAFIGLSFILIYALHPEFWWAIIPAGSLFSVAV